MLSSKSTAAASLALLALASAASSEPAIGATPRIIGGTNATQGEFPYVGQLRLNGDFSCGASILSPEWVLTAAHCVTSKLADGPTAIDAGSISFSFGTIDSNLRNPKPEATVGASLVKFHEKYNPVKVLFDVAVVKLESPLNFTKNVQPIRILNEDINPTTQMKAIGWGKLKDDASGGADTLQEVDLIKLTDKKCEPAFDYFNETDGSLFCTGETAGKDTCYGDSGGPLSKKVGDAANVGSITHGYTLTGVVSFDSAPNKQEVKCGGADIVSYWINVKNMLPWISENTKIPISNLTTGSGSGSKPGGGSGGGGGSSTSGSDATMNHGGGAFLAAAAAIGASLAMFY